MRSISPLTTYLTSLICLGCSGDGTSGVFSDHQLAVIEELRIGSADDPTFTYFAHVEVGPTGNIYTLHQQEAEIRVHNPDGNFVRIIGREGEGPGEFTAPATLGILGDTLWVLDYGTYRFTYFDLSGELLGTRTIPVHMTENYLVPPPRPQGFLSDGSIRGQSPLFPGFAASGEVKSRAVLRLDASGNVTDTIAEYSVENTVWQVSDPNDPNPLHFYRQPFNDTEIVTVSNHTPTVVFVNRRVPRRTQGATYSVTTVSFNGDTVYSGTYPYAPIPVERTLIDSLVNTHAIPADKGGRWARNALYLTEYHPPVDRVLVGKDGSVWLRATAVDGRTTRWRVVSPKGDPAGIVELPPRVVPLLVDGHEMWGRWQDDMDVSYLVRYRISNKPG